MYTHTLSDTYQVNSCSSIEEEKKTAQATSQEGELCCKASLRVVGNFIAYRARARALESPLGSYTVELQQQPRERAKKKNGKSEIEQLTHIIYSDEAS